MTTSLKDGQILKLSSVKSGNLVYNGKPVTLEKDNKDENSQIYKGKVEFTDEEKETSSGKKDVLITYELNDPVGTIRINNALPEDDKDDDFAGLTDAEKFTKMNSIQYQTGVEEVTQIADGSQESPIGVAALASRKEKEESASQKINKKSKALSETQQTQQKEQEQQQEKGGKEKPTSTSTTTVTPPATINTNKPVEVTNTKSSTSTSNESKKSNY